MALLEPIFVQSESSMRPQPSDEPGAPQSRRNEEQKLGLTALERVKLRCAPRSCRIRWVRSKGAILVLLWNCLIADNNGPLSIITAGILGLESDSQIHANHISIAISVIQGLSYILFYPFAGWIADVYFGRYKVIHASLLLMWAGTVTITACLCIQFGTGMQLTPFQYSIFPLALLAIQFGIAGFKANAIPFGTDQLMEGSGNELSAYIHWFVFTIFVSIRAPSVPFSCFVEDSESALIFQLLVQAACLSLALCLDLCFRNWLIIEPGTINPFKTIYQVLNYARKNKHPRFRSAFTYHVEEKPSRIELSKPEFGGPFTVEQVEDVKTFLRMISVVIPMALAFFLTINLNRSGKVLADHIPSSFGCVTRNISIGNALLLNMFLLPIYEFFVYPFLHNLIPSMLIRAAIGTVFIIASALAVLAINAVGHLDRHTSSLVPYLNGTNMSSASTCIFASNAVDLEIDYSWIAVPGILLAIGTLLHFVAVNEFVFAQSPYSMKGLFIGLIYGIQGFFQLIILLLQLPFLLGAVDTSQDFPTCGFFFFLMNVLIAVLALVWYSFAAWKYKRRQRDRPDSYHIFAEEYFDKYL